MARRKKNQTDSEPVETDETPETEESPAPGKDVLSGDLNLDLKDKEVLKKLDAAVDSVDGRLDEKEGRLKDRDEREVPLRGTEEPEEDTEETPPEPADETSGGDVDETSDIEVEDVTDADEPSGEGEEEDELLKTGRDYGLSDEEIREFGSVAELERAMTYYDRRLSETGRQWQEQQYQQYQAAQQPQGQQPQQPQAQTQTQPPRKPTSDEEFEKRIAALKEAGYDESVIELVRDEHNKTRYLEENLTKVAQHLYQQRLTEQQQQAYYQQQQELAQQQAAVAEQEQFLDIVDSLGRDDLFGTDGASTPEQRDNATRLFQETQAMRIGMQAIGRDPGPMSPHIVQRALRSAFPDATRKTKREEVAERVQKGSRRRMGSGQTSKPRAKVPWDGPPEKDPVLRKMYADMEKENGNI